MVELYDLNQPWGANTWPWPYFDDPKVEAVHRFSKDVNHSLKIDTAMHIGTHIDAPLHFAPEGWDISEIPLDRLFGEGLVLDISDKVDEYDIITPEHCKEAADEAGLEIKKGDFLVLYTGWKEYFQTGENPNELTYFAKHPGPHKEFTDWWIEMDFPWVGNDTPAIEHPLNTAIRGYREDLDLPGELEEALDEPIEEVLPDDEWLYTHKNALPENLMMVENLGGDIDHPDVLNERLHLASFPWKWDNGEAAFCRTVAFKDL
jgi:kynurenine formamidase